MFVKINLSHTIIRNKHSGAIKDRLFMTYFVKFMWVKTTEEMYNNQNKT